MIDLAQLQAQLKLLGHDLPEDQVVEILRDMHIEFSAAAPGALGATILTTMAWLQRPVPHTAHARVAAFHALV